MPLISKTKADAKQVFERLVEDLPDEFDANQTLEGLQHLLKLVFDGRVRSQIRTEEDHLRVLQVFGEALKDGVLVSLAYEGKKLRKKPRLSDEEREARRQRLKRYHQLKKAQKEQKKDPNEPVISKEQKKKTDEMKYTRKGPSTKVEFPDGPTRYLIDGEDESISRASARRQNLSHSTLPTKNPKSK